LLCRVPLGAFVYSISIQLKSTWPSFRSSERGEVSSPVRLHYGKWEKIGLIPLKSAIQAEEQNTEAGDRQTVYHRSCPYFGCFLRRNPGTAMFSSVPACSASGSDDSRAFDPFRAIDGFLNLPEKRCGWPATVLCSTAPGSGMKVSSCRRCT